MAKKIDEFEQLKKVSLEELKSRLNADENGLSMDEAKKRLEQYGYNEISEKRLNPLLKFLSYFWGPIPWMIEVAAILSAVLGRRDDAVPGPAVSS